MNTESDELKKSDVEDAVTVLMAAEPVAIIPVLMYRQILLLLINKKNAIGMGIIINITNAGLDMIDFSLKNK